MKLIRSITKSFVVRNSVMRMSLEPPKIKNFNNFNADDFKKEVSVPFLSFDPENVNINRIVRPLKKFLLKMPMFKPVSNGKVYLNPNLVKEYSQLPIDVLAKEGISENSFDYENITLTYINWNANELLKAVLPDEVEPLTSYSRIGHIIHFNLRDEHVPYKMPIAQIFYDKTPGCRTVINKADIIDSTYRNFEIELLKGDADYQVQVKENGITYEFDFSNVFWNPRLIAEHDRLVKMLNPNDSLYDVFAGVGPFSIPAGKKRVKVFANDLNPHSHRWLEHNVKKNKVEEYVRTFNKDGRDFILEDIKNDLIERLNAKEVDPVEDSISIHIAMNLPALAVTFLDAFVGLMKDYENLKVIPICHCYCFVKGTIDIFTTINLLITYSFFITKVKRILR